MRARPHSAVRGLVRCDLGQTGETEHVKIGVGKDLKTGPTVRSTCDRSDKLTSANPYNAAVVLLRPVAAVSAPVEAR